MVEDYDVFLAWIRTKIPASGGSHAPAVGIDSIIPRSGTSG